jgi:hypothetical protein
MRLMEAAGMTANDILDPSGCPNCKARVQTNARFCGYCGAVIDSSTSLNSPVQTPPALPDYNVAKVLAIGAFAVLAVGITLVFVRSPQPPNMPSEEALGVPRLDIHSARQAIAEAEDTIRKAIASGTPETDPDIQAMRALINRTQELIEASKFATAPKDAANRELRDLALQALRNTMRELMGQDRPSATATDNRPPVTEAPLKGDFTIEAVREAVTGKSQQEVMQLLGKPTAGSFGETGHWTYTWPDPSHSFRIVEPVTGFPSRDLTIYFGHGKATFVMTFG